MNHANRCLQILLPLLSCIIVAAILTARRRNLFIRRIPGLSAIEEAVGRATEMGRPMIGTTGLNTGIEIVGLQALAIVTYIVRVAARYSTRMIVPVYEPQMLPVTEEAVREAFTVEGRPDLYRSEDVRFLTNRQFAYAAAVSGTILRERPAACFYFGNYFAESMILAEAGQHVGAIQVAGTSSILQIPFFIAACDYVIIGDEFYAAGAYLSREPTAMGSIVGQDIVKAIILVLVLLGSAIVSYNPNTTAWITRYLLK